ncbi:Fe-S protein assembly co-chaperone HscB [Paramagnetospirillum kuznetsovii]|uniref:Co-chaperone protein HscB homolog n=1 Tax=Paramagnetospirillum kuznetsovii TaxID=2053833 RepID=A0A364NX28_9PROT|nr:Fe-S protein assembly co-chaperone HscB [Paramagnetospirillum kuznetsovii]RAU21467.1 Fe-S protein assembly co-chaperone HscB [Paramagnetospirillum kuznetsovii]
MNASAVAAVSPCWSCKGPVATRALFCSVCGAVQGPGAIDHYSRLGMTPSFDIDQDQLQTQYFGFQRRLHPDRFAAKSAREKALSQSQATALNEAYETLKDPLKRAAYLLGLLGHPVDLTACGTINDRELLMEQMEKREALSEATTPEQVAKLAMENESEVIACQCHISAAFNSGNLDEASHLSIRLKYLVKLAEEARSKKSRITRLP